MSKESTFSFLNLWTPSGFPDLKFSYFLLGQNCSQARGQFLTKMKKQLLLLATDIWTKCALSTYKHMNHAFLKAAFLKFTKLVTSSFLELDRLDRPIKICIFCDRKGRARGWSSILYLALIVSQNLKYFSYLTFSQVFTWNWPELAKVLTPAHIFSTFCFYEQSLATPTQFFIVILALNRSNFWTNVGCRYLQT